MSPSGQADPPRTTGVLDEIVAHKREEVAARAAVRSLAALRAQAAGRAPGRDLAAALRPRAGRRVGLIAEVKKASPSRGVLAPALDPGLQARAYAAAGAAAISVLTDARWFGGSLEDLVTVSAAVDVPVLRKEFVVHEYQLWESRVAGADAVLLIVAALERERLRDLFATAAGIGLGTLVEAHTAAELETALALGAPVIGVNNRNLQTLETDLAVSLALLPRIPVGTVAVSESGLVTRDDVGRVVKAGAHAVLVGEALVRAPDVAAKVRELTLADGPA